jgi:hypothetical protein
MKGSGHTVALPSVKNSYRYYYRAISMAPVGSHMVLQLPKRPRTAVFAGCIIWG